MTMGRLVSSSDPSNKYHHSHIIKVTFTDTSNTTVTNLQTYASHVNHVFTEIILLKNSVGDKKLLIAGYLKSRILKDSDFTEQPELGSCFYVWSADITGTPTLQEVLPPNVYQYRKLLASEDSQAFYYLLAKDRTESNTGLELWKATYDDNFEVTQKEFLGSISDAVYGESNNLSNIALLKYEEDLPESIYGISSAYYINPINKVTSKNFLWKYDVYLSGIIELADFSGMKIWDAITQLAHAFNYIAGFSGKNFFFIPKAISPTPDIILDLDNDPNIEIEKIQDENVQNIITAIPYRAIKKEIEWSVILVNNDTIQEGKIVNDFGRVKLDVNLRVRQDDDLTKDIILRTTLRGEVPPTEDGNPTTLRMSYLVYNTTIETKLIRDIEADETKIYLPSFFGDTLDVQLGVGDIFAIHDVDPDTEETFYITRVITDIDFTSNEITLESSLGKRFTEFTPVSIFRSFATSGSRLRNNSWSDEGVTYIKGTQFNEVSTTERSIDVASITNLGVGTIIKFGNRNTEFIITSIEEKNETSGLPRIYFKAYTGSLIDSGDVPDDLIAAVIRAFWVPQENELIEVGGSKVFLGFDAGSTGTFWNNSKGSDRIEIKCPGLVLESDAQSKITAADLDSINAFGKITQELDENRFIQIPLLQHLIRRHLKWNSRPKNVFQIQNIIQSISEGGESFSIPVFKLINTSERKLFNIRIISRKYLSMFPGFTADHYILEHNINLKNFIQNLKVRQIPIERSLSPKTPTIIIPDSNVFVNLAAQVIDAYYNALPNQASFILYRNKGTDALNVNFSISGTAIESTDYEEITTESFLTIPEDEDSLTVTITPISAGQTETKTVIITLETGTGYELGSSKTITIFLRNFVPVVSISAVDNEASFDDIGDTGIFRITRTGNIDEELVVNFTVSGTAEEGTEYESIGTSATILAGESSIDVEIIPIAGTDSKTVIITLDEDNSYDVGDDDSDTVNIIGIYINLSSNIQVQSNISAILSNLNVSTGVPVGGTTGQVLKKSSNDDYNTEWDDISWGEIKGLISDQTDLQSALNSKANTVHTHTESHITDLDKYTQSEVDNLLSGKSDTGHTHDDRYYTETETDTLLSGKANTSHTHVEADITDLGNYSVVGHTHDDRYYTETELNNGQLDTRYYTEAEITTLLSGKENTITTLAVTKGGTGLSSLVQGDILYGSAANTLSALAKSSTATRYLANTGTNNNPAWDQINLANGVTGDLPFANLTQGSALSVLGVTGNATADVASIAAGTDHQVLRRSGTSLAFGAINLASSNAVTGTLIVGNGGTGQTTLTANKVLVGNGTTGILSPTNLHWDNSNSRLGITETSPQRHLHVGSNNGIRLSNRGELISAGFHESVMLTANEYYTGSGDPVANMQYINSAGTNSSSGMLLFIDGNGGETGVRMDVYTAATSTGADDPVTNNLRFRITSRGALLQDGSNTEPSLAFIADLDTGLFRAANDILGFTTAGTERLRISTGRFGFRTTTLSTTINISPEGGAQGVNLMADPNNSAQSGRFFFSNGTPGQSMGMYNDNAQLHIATGGTPGTSSGTSMVRISSTGMSIGNISPSAKVHAIYNGVSINSVSTLNDGIIIQALTGGRSLTSGAQLEFAIPANTDGSGSYGQGRIITVAGNTNNNNATGKMILGVKRFFDKTGAGTNWYYDDLLTLDGSDSKVKVLRDLEVTGDIIQDDIVRPFFSLDHPAEDVEDITITINKFDNTASANDRMMVHWWVSTTQFGSPNHTGTTGVSYTLGAGESSITSYNHAITDGNRQIKIHLIRAAGQPSITLYLMCEVQGIVFASDSFTIIGV
jgi:hypothetical protein